MRALEKTRLEARRAGVDPSPEQLNDYYWDLKVLIKHWEKESKQTLIRDFEQLGLVGNADPVLNSGRATDDAKEPFPVGPGTPSDALEEEAESEAESET